jgi:diguanylate cyclase (GGDEF)-like protein/putative nucleotidyltransferase with HDIG domain
MQHGPTIAAPTGSDLERHTRSAPAAWRWLTPRGRLSYLAIGGMFGLYAGTLLWATEQRGLIVLLAVALCVSASFTLQLNGGRFFPVLGYVLGLVGTGLAVYGTPLGILGYVGWIAWGAIVLSSWTGLGGFGVIEAAGYVAARGAAHVITQAPFIASTTLIAGVAVGAAHVATRLLIREIRAREDLAMTDFLTGIANRRMLQWRLTEELAEAKRTGETLALLYMDVDGFKRLNDKFGHQTGDKVLVKIAETLRETVRTHDLVARAGGDEFVILAPRLGENETVRLATRLQEAVAQVDLPMPLSLSVGWVLATRDGATPEELLDHADAGLFEHKRQTRQVGQSLASELLEALRGLPDGARHLVRLLDKPDLALEVEEHLEKVGHWSLELAKQLGLPPDRQHTLAQAALLHDVGKLGLSQSLLLKHTPLSPQERAHLVQHVTKGVALLRTLDVDESVISIVAAHHERWDGTGYPARLVGEMIPLEARILTIADSYDAMTTYRVYHKALSHERAIAELRCESGRQFDPQLVNLLIERLTSENNEPTEHHSREWDRPGRDIDSSREEKSPSRSSAGNA